jgi:hypothetical protein
MFGLSDGIDHSQFMTIAMRVGIAAEAIPRQQVGERQQVSPSDVREPLTAAMPQLARAQREGASCLDSFKRHFGPEPRM